MTPGFIDLHTHYDAQVTWSSRIDPSTWNGVTTAMIGNCGVGFAPCKPEQRDMLVKLMEGVEDIPEVVLTEGLPWNWQSFEDYLDALEARPYDLDVVTQVPHAALRVFVMGAARRRPRAGDGGGSRADGGAGGGRHQGRRARLLDLAHDQSQDARRPAHPDAEGRRGGAGRDRRWRWQEQAPAGCR